MSFQLGIAVGFFSTYADALYMLQMHDAGVNKSNSKLKHYIQTVPLLLPRKKDILYMSTFMSTCPKYRAYELHSMGLV